MIDTDNIFDGGTHTLAATFTKLDESSVGFRVLTIRANTLTTNAEIGLLSKAGDVEQTVFIKTDESWTFGPDAGTIRPSDIYLLGTAGNGVGWIGMRV
jgi:hypothetical protein